MCRASMLLFVLLPAAMAVVPGRAVAETAAGSPGDAVVGEEEPTAAPAPIFPDPILVQRARTYRAVGITLSILGGAAFVVSFNVSLSVFRSGNERAREMMPYWLVPCLVVTGVGLTVGGPLWAVGSEMHRQLTRNTRGDEKLRREVANDKRYWRGRTMVAFGTTLALSGGLGLTVGALLLVGGVWVAQRSAELTEAGLAISPWVIGAPAIMIGAGTGMLVGGLKLRKDGLDRSDKVREAYATTQLIPIPFFDPIAGSGGLALVGTF